MSKEGTPPREYYAYVKRKQCCKCGAYGVHSNPIEAAHIRSIVSPKTGELLPRSHKGIAGWGCVSLCKACHLELHERGEETFTREIWPNVHAHVATNILGFHLEKERS